jgi:H/ACA ribonucleoprotein complex subunit 3
MTKLYYCMQCNNYTMQSICPHCKNKTIERKPARFSPQDHYGSYRRKLIKQQKKEVN